MDASYAALVGHRPARRLLYALATTTLSYGMLTLTVLLTVERSTGSYRTAGFAVAAWALMAAVSAPFRGRLIDRAGARVWLPAMASGYAAFLVALDLAAPGGAPGWALVLLASFAAGSVTGALWYGSRVWRLDPFERYLRGVLLVGVLVAPAVLAASPAALGVVLFFTGLAFGPATVALFETLDVLVPGSG